jgi:hypothetical protein
MDTPGILAVIWGGIVPAVIVTGMVVNLAANNFVDNHARANGKMPLASQRRARGVRR